MEDLIESIRAALIADATHETRARGAHACRTILTALDATPGEPMTATAVPPTAAPPDAAQIANVVGALRGMPPDQLLDLAIARLRAALPPDAAIPIATPIKFQLIPVPPTMAKK